MAQGQPLRRDRSPFDEMDDDEMIYMMREMRENDVTSPTSMRTGDDEHEVTMTPAAMSPPRQASIDEVLSALRTMKEELRELRERETELREREREFRQW